jgi:hypothetical protein
MTGEIIELIIEFSVILLSPVIYHLYLLKYKKLPKELVFKDIKIYLVLYGLIAITGLFLLFR